MSPAGRGTEVRACDRADFVCGAALGYQQTKASLSLPARTRNFPQRSHAAASTSQSLYLSRFSFYLQISLSLSLSLSLLFRPSVGLSRDLFGCARNKLQTFLLPAAGEAAHPRTRQGKIEEKDEATRQGFYYKGTILLWVLNDLQEGRRTAGEAARRRARHGTIQKKFK
jgi:hypothetical protein